jgi:protoheme IX farnesyltransferase
MGLASMLVLWPTVGALTAALTFCCLIGYAVVYTKSLKRATPQNIVIGGAAGAAPPVLGWAAVTHGIPFTCRQIMLYTILLCVSTVLPVLTNKGGGSNCSGR